MNSKLKGTLVGIAMSLIGVALWIAIYYFMGLITGIAAFVMVYLCYYGYNKFNKEDKSKYWLWLTIIVLVVGMVVAELITLLLLAADVGITIGYVFSVPEYLPGIIRDTVFGVIFGAVAIIYLFFQIKKQNQQKATGAGGAIADKLEETGTQTGEDTMAGAPTALDASDNVAPSENKEE